MAYMWDQFLCGSHYILTVLIVW